MLKEIRPQSCWSWPYHHHRPCLSAGHDRYRRRALSLPGARQPDREGRQGDRSELIGQQFASDKYFHGRPSPRSARPSDPSKTTGVPYNAANSGAPISAHQQGAHRPRHGDVDKLKQEKPVGPGAIDLVTTSAAALTRHLPASAYFQVPRVAKAATCRKCAPRSCRRAHRGRTLGVFGEPRVNVLELNLALDHAGTQ
jgi:K+-transporting ATPase ATPase C chain